MTIAADKSLIKAVWSGLSEPAPERSYPLKVQSFVDRITATGWAYGTDIEDLPSYMDPRLDLIRDVKYRDLAATLGLPVRYVYKQPRKSDGEVTSYPALSAADFAYLLITLERLGFVMDPEPLVRALRPALLQQAEVTEQERQVILYEKQRHRMATMYLHNKPSERFSDLNEQKLTTSAGYKVTLQTTDLGEPLSLTVKAPKYRRAKTDASAF